MHVYESSDYNETGAFLRLISAIKLAKDNQRRFSVFVGAGCSISSSPSDISTISILGKTIKEHYDAQYKPPISWEELYQDFVNYVWEPFGEVECVEILSGHFLNLTPSKGYMYLRKLVEAGYVTDIVTTNFDMLINDALDGLSYHLKVGDLQGRSIKGSSRVRVLKIHGDIESGQLRFSPKDLDDLPIGISKRIQEASANASLFCGYRGQDKGLMKSLDKTPNYATYWASPKKPMKSNVFENQMLYDWMKSRNSESNFIFGDTLGKFDDLMERICINLELIDGESVKGLDFGPESAGILLWKKSTVSKAICINERVYSMFLQLLQSSSELREEHEWRREFPFYSKDYETTLNAFLFYYRESSQLPFGLMQVPENEIEALLMGLAIEIIASTSGIGICPISYSIMLKKRYEDRAPNYQPDTSFWGALEVMLVSIKSNTPLHIDEGSYDVKLKMNSQGRMTLGVKEPKLRYLVDTISLLSVSGLFIPTCENESGIDRIGESKLLLQKHGQGGIDVTDDKLFFKLEGITKQELSDIFYAFFDNLGGYRLDENNAIIGPKVKIASSIEERASVASPSSLIDYLYEMASNTSSRFMKLKSAFEIDGDTYIRGHLSDTINNFVDSEKIAMFIVGSSGAGKTKSIQHFMETHRKSDDHLIAVASPKICSFDNSLGLAVFWGGRFVSSGEETLLREIDAVLSLRGKKMILIIDGLNEIDGGISACAAHYRSIIETIDKLEKLNINSINVLVTCRDNAFLDYCERTALYPNAENCFCVIENKTITPYYQIQPLTLEAQLQFANLYFEDSIQKNAFETDIKTNPYYQQMFGQPYLIAIAGKNYNFPKESFGASRLQHIFKLFAEQMLKRLGSTTTSLVARNVIDTYFDLVINAEFFGRKITPFVLLNQLKGVDAEDAHVVLKQLCDINVFTSMHSEEYIRFTHDRIEEYFLCEYLYARANQSDVLKDVANIAKCDPVFYHAITNYFRKLIGHGAFSHFAENCNTLYDSIDSQLPCVIAACFDSLSEDKYIQLFSTVDESPLGLDMFASLLLDGLNQAITRSDVNFPETLIGSYGNLSSIFHSLAHYKKYFYYTSSKFYLIQKGNLELAERYCDEAMEYNAGNDEHLTQLLILQKAVMQKSVGSVDEATEKLAAAFSYFSKNEHWDSAAEAVLEWGSILRQKTKFEDALRIYNLVDVNHVAEYPALQMKLRRKKGTVHKNIMQRLLKSYHKNCENDALAREIRLFYEKAHNELEAAMKMSVSVVDAIEKMTIMTELAETSLKFSQLEPNQMLRAKFLLNEVEKKLITFPVPDIQIIQLRHTAKYNELNGKLGVAIETLQRTRNYALVYAKNFRVFEVDYQLGRLIERHKEKLSHGELLQGVSALKSAIETNEGQDSDYVKNCIESLARLEKFIESIF